MDEALQSAGLRADVTLLGFALTDCVVETDKESAKYLRAVHRTALELATPNQFGADIGGYWLMWDQVAQLRKLPTCYPSDQQQSVSRAVENYLKAQSGTDLSL
jgi:hypothetical protein